MKLLQIFFRQLLLILLILFLSETIISFSTLLFANGILITLTSVFIIYTIYQLITTLYEGLDTFITETKFKFNNMTKKLFIKDQLIDYLVSSILFLLTSYVIYLLYDNFEVALLMYGFIFIVLLLILYNTLFVVLFIPLLFELKPLENDNLIQKLDTISKKEGFSIQDIVVINASKKTTKINAYFSGFGKRKKVMLFDTLLDQFTEDQLLAIVAHEIGHSKHNHMLKDLLFDILLAFVYFALFYVILQLNIVETSSNPFIYGIIYSLVTLEFVHKLLKGIKNTISRRHEKQADMYCKEMGYGKELIYNLSIAAKANKGNLTPHPLFMMFKYDHPAYYDRVDYLID